MVEGAAFHFISHLRIKFCVIYGWYRQIRFLGTVVAGLDGSELRVQQTVSPRENRMRSEKEVARKSV